MIKLYIKGLYCLHKTKKIFCSITDNSKTKTDTEIKIFEINDFCIKNFHNNYIIFIRKGHNSGYFFQKNKDVFNTFHWEEVNSLNELIKKYIKIQNMKIYGNIETTRTK